MAKNGFLLFNFLSFILFLPMSILGGAITSQDDRKVHIVYLGSLSRGEYETSSQHQSILQEVIGDSSVENVLVRSYKRSFNGFAAKLTDRERQKLASMEGVVSVFPSRTLQLHTTRSWDFMGLNQSITRKRSVESDIIVGVIDSGIWPESESFSDEGFGPAPKKWKGACKGGRNFTCNNKIIGARYYTTDDISGNTARDIQGHGTHTASTASGNEVKDASFFGVGQGTARGGVPSARIAAYKVCSPELGCAETAILGAFDDAIADGVDIITISLGGQNTLNFTEDVIAIGSFHAMAKGVLTLHSAGNSGPFIGSTVSVAPWLMSVAASNTDRLFVDKVVLGSGQTLVGYSINSFSSKGKTFPLVDGMDVSRPCESDFDPQLCTDGQGCIDSRLAKGKIVICQSFDGFNEVHKAGAEGSVSLNDVEFNKVSSVVSLPAVALNEDNFNSIYSYLKSTKKPEANILSTEAVKDSEAPVVADFSSRGPNEIVPDILKPDISAPGVDILAAFSPLGAVSDDPEDKRQAKFNVVSGTSMSCPHAAGVAAYVKSFHPDWSPSAIKSAIMTTAWPMNSSKNKDAEFAFGSGHINPVEAVNPGLVYETFEQDYIIMLCSMGYDERNIGKISGNISTCPKGSDKATPKDLNYPSMAAQVSPGKSFTINFPRTVTNVGLANSTYKAKILQNSKIVSIKVVPESLSFKSLNEKKSFSVTVTGKGLPNGAIVSTSLMWSDGNHRVRSPIVVHSQSHKSDQTEIQHDWTTSTGKNMYKY
ncbi:subtilisin-like protease SBT4.4 [Citrus sinensis]|uniref:Subtilisin-like protease SBT4.4 n=1 Tax=Citrus sinensis TaxID=2711 RepID=A0ACB8KCC8_CITSI|nr:subtilisin-like protease SBT4.4 [Citrus sinensis]